MSLKSKLAYLLVSVVLLVGCDNYDYKGKIQKEYDYNNKTGHRAVCVSSAFLDPVDLPYTIRYLGEPNGTETRQERANLRDNERQNQRLHYFAGHGLLTEELVGEQEGKPLYRYDLTDEGKQAVKWAYGMMSFCFGRVVVDSIGDKRDGINGVGGGTIRHVDITYHVENIPDWIKDPEIYQQYDLEKALIEGKKVRDTHRFNVSSDGKLRSRGGVNGRVKP